MFRTLAAVLALAVVPALAGDRDGDGYATPQDCNDGNKNVHPGAPESCDGFDDACTGVVDGGCLRSCAAPRAGLQFPLGTAPGASRGPRVARSVKGVDIAWVDDRDGNPELYLARLDLAGKPLYPETRLTNGPASSSQVALASAGDWRALAWIDTRDGVPQVWFLRHSDSGLNNVGPVRVTSAPSDVTEPAIAWANGEWAVAWAEKVGTSYQVKIDRVTDTGIPTKHPVTVSATSGNARRPALAFDGSGYGVVWDDSRHGAAEIYFRRLSGTLSPVGGEVRVTNAAGDSLQPAIAWAGNRFAVGWQDARDGNAEAYAAVLAADGPKVGSDLRLSDTPGTTEAPRLAYTGGEVVAAFVDDALGTPQLFTARFSRTGTILEPGRAVPGVVAAGALASADVAWTGDVPVVAWQDAGDASIGVLFPVCCGDLDGDGFDRCDGDCDDSRAAVHPGAPEACNGIDDDCDGNVDEGCARTCAGPDLSVPQLAHLAADPENPIEVDLAWNGAAAGLAWSETDALYTGRVLFQRVDGAGAPLAAPVILSDPAHGTSEPAVAATPDGWGVFSRVTIDGDTWQLQVLDSAGTVVSTHVADTWGVVADPGLVWDGRGFAAAFQLNDASYFLRYSASGAPIEPLVQLGGFYTRHPALAWNGREYAVAIEESGHIDMLRLDALGRIVNGPKRVDQSRTLNPHYPHLAWTGTGYGLVYVENYREVHFVLLDADGNAASPLRVLYGTDYHWVWNSTLAWNGEEFYAQWYDEDANRLLVRRLAADGTPVGDPVTINGTGLLSGDRRSAIAAVGGAFLSAWAAHGTAPDALVTRTLGCCVTPDLDEDGYCKADCDEGDPYVHPGAVEICDGKDDDCDGVIPANETTDEDRDGYAVCMDCDDHDPLRHPGAVERCNGLDDDCDGVVAGEVPPTARVTGLRFASRTLLNWDDLGFGTLYDVQRGGLRVLVESGGDFARATTDCLYVNYAWPNAYDPALPSAGNGFLYLVAASTPVCNGSYDEAGPSQAGSRDEGIARSGAACP